MLLAGDPARAQNALDAHLATGVHGQLARADQTLLRAGISALQDRSTGALVDFREALTGYRDLGVDFRIAIAGLVMASVLDAAAPDVRAAAEAARLIFTRLRAKPMLEALDRSLARRSSGVSTHLAATAPAGVPAT